MKMFSNNQVSVILQLRDDGFIHINDIHLLSYAALASRGMTEVVNTWVDKARGIPSNGVYVRLSKLGKDVAKDIDYIRKAQSYHEELITGRAGRTACKQQ